MVCRCCNRRHNRILYGKQKVSTKSSTICFSFGISNRFRKTYFIYLMNQIKDTYGRGFKTLRVSLLNSCNLGCVYCVAGDDNFLKKNNLSSTHQSGAQELLPIIEKLHDVLHLETIRLTG